MEKVKKGVIRGRSQEDFPKCNTISTNEKIFVGIDPSLRSTGLIVLDQDQCIMEQKVIKTDKSQSDEESMSYLMDELGFIPKILRLHSVYIESPYVGHRNNTLQLGAIHYLIRIFLFKNSVSYKLVPPKTLKKFIAGNGNANKEGVMNSIKEKYNLNFEDNNLADAFSLAIMALEDFRNGIR